MTSPEPDNDDVLFRVVEVTANPDSQEPIGSKTKFWFRHDATHARWLFKEARAGTGEDWAEKIAAEIAELLGLPHATVELARHHGVPGIVTKDFTSVHATWKLVHGNELLFQLDPKYPKGDGYRVHQHTLDAVRAALSQGTQLPDAAWPKGVSTPWDGFLGYLMLDALIGNTDRHHQNWGLLVPVTGEHSAMLAPTFDHASSLIDRVPGPNMSDPARRFALALLNENRACLTATSPRRCS